MAHSPFLSKAALIEAAYEITGGNLKDLSYDQLCRLMTVTQFVTDLCLNEIERRHELTYDRENGGPIVPYMCEHQLATVLTRRGPRRSPGPPGSPGLSGVRGYWRSIPRLGSGQLMSKAELLSAADTVLSGEARDQSTTQLQRRMTVAQFVTDLCLNEIENRGALEIEDGEVALPYHAEHWVDTVLTRPR